MSKNYKLKVKLVKKSARLPKQSHSGDIGFDLYAAEEVTINPGSTKAVGTGIAVELPPMTEGQIRPRSGLALNHQITVLNSPGTIDEGFRGEVRVILINHGQNPYNVQIGAKIAQLVVAPRLQVDIIEVGKLSDTTRGNSGFGSTDDVSVT